MQFTIVNGNRYNLTRNVITNHAVITGHTFRTTHISVITRSVLL